MKWDQSQISEQHGKRVLITGANSGIGLEAAKVLAAKGAEVILAVRNPAKGQRAIETILKSHPKAQIRQVALDLSDLDSVAACVNLLVEEGNPIDALINNAGVMMLEQHTRSAQGHEMQWATNHLGHFALSSGLMPLLQLSHQGRIVTLSSVIAKMRMAKIYYEDINFEKSYDKVAAYAQSKLANAMFAMELHRRLQQSGSSISSVAAHPGYTATNLQQHMGKLGVILNALFAQKVTMGALPTLKAATDTQVASGSYIGPLGLANYRGYPGVNRLPIAATQAESCLKLWEITEAILGQPFFNGT
jgi:NAD(P)-dependent dehydrogenase (short-subunit alcohol dehydrogenase family)